MAATRRVRLGAFTAVGLAVALGLALVVAPWASSEPDGLEKVAIDHGFAAAERPHDLADAPTAGYAVEGVEDDRLATGLAGGLGVVVTFAVGGGLVLLLRRGRRGPATTAAAGAGTGIP